MSQENKITFEESEKLKDLVGTVKNLEAASEEAIKGGGTKIEDAQLDRAKRKVDSYTKYLSARYSESAESFITNLETNAANDKEKAKTSEAAEVELLDAKSPTNVKDNEK